MNDKINTGGPAFPCHADIVPSKDVDYAGMTLRDYFAAKAMQGICAHHDSWGLCDNEIAQNAYVLADAMLKAREVTQ